MPKGKLVSGSTRSLSTETKDYLITSVSPDGYVSEDDKYEKVALRMKDNAGKEIDALKDIKNRLTGKKPKEKIKVQLSDKRVDIDGNSFRIATIH